MTNYREILRLHNQGFSTRDISLSTICARNTVLKVIQKARDVNLSWQQCEDLTNQQLRKILFPDYFSRSQYHEPDFEQVHKELSKSGVTLSLLWYEYSANCRQNQMIPYKYSPFCKLYSDFTNKTKATMRIKHKPGEKLEVDWAGQTIHLKDVHTGNLIKAYVFVATLPYSGYSYVEAILPMYMESWIR